MINRERVRVYKRGKFSVTATLESKIDPLHRIEATYYCVRYAVAFNGMYVHHEYTPRIYLEDIKEWHREDAHEIYFKYVLPMYGRDTMRIAARKCRDCIRHIVAGRLAGKTTDELSEFGYLLSD